MATGFINEQSLEELQAVVVPRLNSLGLEIRNAQQVTAALQEFDKRHCGFERAHFLYSLASSDCELLECVERSSGNLVGYSLVLEHPTLVQVEWKW